MSRSIRQNRRYTINPAEQIQFVPPPSLSPLFWVRADKGFTPSQWNDLSTSGNNAVQATGGNQPSSISSSVLGNRTMIRFNGTTSFMTTSSAINLGGNNNPCSVAAVIVNNQSAGTGSILTANGFRLLNLIGGKWAYFSQQTDSGEVSALSTATAYCLIAVQVSNTSVLTWTNGVQFNLTSTVIAGGTAPSTIGANTSGANQFGQIDIGEIIVSPTIWNLDQVSNVRNYFTQTWGFPA